MSPKGGDDPISARLIHSISGIVGSMRGNGLRAHLVRNALGSAGVQVSSRVLALVLSIILARSLGPEGYGVYAHAFAIQGLLMVVAVAGVPPLLMRELAAAEGIGAWGLLRGALLRGLQLVAVSSVSTSILGFIALIMFADKVSPNAWLTMALMLLALPIAALVTTLAHGLAGLQKVVIGQSLELIVHPLLVICFVSIIFILQPELRTPWVAVAGQLAALALIATASAKLIVRFVPAAARDIPAEFDSRKWLRSAPRFALLGAALVINTNIDLVMLDWYMTATEVGIYRVAVQGAALVTLSLLVVNSVTASQVARLYAQQDIQRLQRLVTWSARVTSVTSVLIFMVMAIEGKEVISWFFGNEFSDAYVPLMILALGQLASAVFGISGPLLTMTGHERIQSQVIWLAVGANVIMNLFFIPWLGIIGAALSTAVTLVGWRACLAWISFARLGVNVFPIGIEKTRVH